MKHVFAIVASFCVASVLVLADQQQRGIARNHVRSASNLMDSLGKDTFILHKRGWTRSKGRKQEDPKDRTARLARMTPTDATLEHIVQNPNQVELPKTRYPTVAKVLSRGPQTSTWSRTQDMRKADHHPPNRDFTFIKHDRGSAVGGSSRSDDGTVAANVEGRRVESRIVTSKQGQGHMRIELGRQTLKGEIGPNSKAHVQFRHPNPSEKFAITSELKGKGVLATQGQGHFGSSDVTENDTNAAGQPVTNPVTRK